MANPKQRYQSPSLGDTLRLQNFILSNSLPTHVATVAKVEIFRVNEKMRSIDNPRGLVLRETIVNNLGSANPRIFPYPQVTNAQYWETRIVLDEDEYAIDNYVDRWHLILDPAYDLENPIARKPSTQFDNEDGLGWVSTVSATYATTSSSSVSIGTGSKVFSVASGLPYTGGETVRVTVNGDPSSYVQGQVISYIGSELIVNINATSGSGVYDDWIISSLSITTIIDVGSNRGILENGINNNSGSKLTIAEATEALITKGINTTGSFEPSVGLMGSIGSIYGSIITGFTGGVGGDHIGGQKVSYFALTTNDGGSTWTGSIESNPGISSNNHPISISATFSTVTNILTIIVEWSAGNEPSTMKIIPVFVDKWLLEATYDPNASNAWDDLIKRTEPSKIAVTDHDFKVHPVLWQSSPAPIVSDYDWLVNPTEVYLETISWLRVTIEPRVPDNPESVRLHYAYISSGRLRYELYRIQDDSLKLRLIGQNTIDWHAENKGLFKIDTNRAPLNRAQDCYIIFYVDLPDGSIIRSPKIVLSIRDDRVSFSRNVQERTNVF
jgi:hypothetical protein